MSAFQRRVAEVTRSASIERLAGGDLSEVLLVRRAGMPPIVAKGGPAVSTEAAMLRVLARAGISVPGIEGEHEEMLLLEHVPNDGRFSAPAWGDVGRQLGWLHEHRGERFGWPTDYSLGSVQLDNRQQDGWPVFWGEQRLASAANMLDRPWRERTERIAARLSDLLPPQPAPSLLHGDLWSGNILVRGGRVAGFIDPACYYGHAEVDLAMLTLFDSPSDTFWAAYGAPAPGWSERRPVYQLFPALVHLRLFGTAYAGLVDRLLSEAGA